MIIFTSTLAAQVVNIADGNNIIIANGATLNIAGLELTPNADYSIVGENSVSKESEVITKIKQLLEDHVRPAVEMDGGAIDFKSFEEGIVTVTMKGSCSGCPSSTLTLKAGIENLLKRMIPEVEAVEAEAA